MEEEIRILKARILELEEKIQQQDRELQQCKAEIISLSKLKIKSKMTKTSDHKLFGWF